MQRQTSQQSARRQSAKQAPTTEPARAPKHKPHSGKASGARARPGLRQQTQRQQQSQQSAPHQQKKNQSHQGKFQSQGQASNRDPASNQDQSQAQEQDQYQYPEYKQEESRLAPGMMRPLPEETVLEWKAPSRPFKKRDKKFFTTVIVIALLVALIVIFAGQGILPVALIFSVVFLVYVLSVVPPQTVLNKITNYGIRVDDNLYFWQELGRFWQEKKHDQQLINIETARFPGRITLVLRDYSWEEIRTLLSEVLLNEEPEPTFYDKASNWLQEKIPLE